jgi:hypothetical protein
MSDRRRDGRPEYDPADARVARLRDRAMDLLADATVHVQRLEEIGERLGLTPDLADGVGDHLYHAIVAQLDLAAKVVERSHVAAERVLQLGADRWSGESRFQRVDVKRGERARYAFTVRNASIRTAKVEVELRFVPSDAATVAIGTKTLHGRHSTSVEVTFDGAKLGAGPHAGEVHVVLVHGVDQRLELPRRCFEVWVHE